MEINVTAALTKCDALSLSLSVRSHGAQRSLARSLAGGGGRGVKNLSISDGDAAHIVNVAPVVATRTPAAKVFNLGQWT